MNALKKIIDKEGILFVTMQLGYSTPVTVKRWIAANKIPQCSEVKVRNFIRSYNENNKRKN